MRCDCCPACCAAHAQGQCPPDAPVYNAPIALYPGVTLTFLHYIDMDQAALPALPADALALHFCLTGRAGFALPEGGTPVYFGDGCTWDTPVNDIYVLHTRLKEQYPQLPLLLMGYGSIALVMVTLILTAFSDIVSIWYCFKKLHMRIKFGKFDFSLLRDMAGFSFFIFLNEIINQINWTVDTTLLGIISGTAATAIYGVGSQINQYYMALSTSISGVFTPQINRIVAHGEGDEQLTRLFTRVGRIQFMLLALVLTGFIFVGSPFVRAWGGEEYAQAYPIALLLIGPVTVPLIQNIGIEIQRAKNMHQFRSKVYFCMAIGNAIVSVPLGMALGGIGCALGTAISMIVGNGFIMNWYYQTHIGLDMRYFWKNILKIVPAMLPPIALGILAVSLHSFEGYSGVLTFAAPYAALYAVCLYAFAMDDSEKNMVRDVMRKIRR